MWEQFIQGIGTKWANSAIDARYNQAFELEKMKLQALGPFGALYTEGSAIPPGQVVAQGSIPASWLLIGGLVAVVLLAGD